MTHLSKLTKSYCGAHLPAQIAPDIVLIVRLNMFSTYQLDRLLFHTFLSRLLHYHKLKPISLTLSRLREQESCQLYVSTTRYMHNFLQRIHIEIRVGTSKHTPRLFWVIRKPCTGCGFTRSNYVSFEMDNILHESLH